MIKILFVDDEPKILRGLQRMLSTMEKEWKVTFAAGGQEALELLAQQPYDVVVSDMRMPEMDGATLLNEVMGRYPEIIRIVLSGYSEQELVLRSAGTAHQYLAKPCDLNHLDRIVTRTIALRRFLANPSLRALVSRLNTIPSVPQLYRDLILMVNTTNKSLRDLGNLIAQDIGMTAKILQIVNSAFFGLPRHVSDPAHAACLIGFDVLKALILTAHIFSELPVDGVQALGLGALWHHSTETGPIARKIALAEGGEPQVCDHALMAGLLHDTGKLILAVNLPQQYREMLSLSAKDQIPALEAEQKVFGATHAEVGAYLLGIWGLPDPIIEAVAFHHRPADAETHTMPLTAVHVADALEHKHREGNEETGTERLDMEYLKKLGLAERLPVWEEQCSTLANSTA